jgi:FMN phosphatase YigB (HAD superfamily)
VFKLALAVYRHAAEGLGRPIEEVWLVSANMFDCAGAKAGMRVAAVERERAVRYAFAEPPDLVVPDLLELASTLVPTT